MTDHLQTFLLRLTNWLLKFRLTKCEEQIYPGHAKKSNLSFCCLKVMDRLPRSRFFLSILWCSLTGNHPQEEFQIWLQVRGKWKILATCWKRLSKYGNIRKKTSLEILQLGTFFSEKKSFVWVTLDFILSPSSKNLPKTKTFP
jgi:hypothetical protein